MAAFLMVSTMKNAYFTFDFYAQIFGLLKEKGYLQSFFRDEEVSEKKVYFRHDVDFCPEIAYQFAQFESRLGVYSTYFVMVNTPLYNVFHTETTNLLKKMIEMGHDIGLHFVLEETVDLALLRDKIDSQCSLLSHLLGKEVKAFSFHRPAYLMKNGFQNTDILIPGKFNAYHPEFFKVDSYISDSNHHWRCGNPLEFIAQHSGDTLQILTHPIWWTAQSDEALNKINVFLENKKINTSIYVADNITLFR